MIVKYFDIYESELESAPFNPGAVYFCSDTKNMYYDRPETNERVKMGDVIILETDEERELMLAPIPFKLYYIKENCKFYMNDGTNWVAIGSSDFTIHVSGNDVNSLTADKEYNSILSAYNSGLSIRMIFNGLNLYLNEFVNNCFVFNTTTSTEDVKYMLIIKITIDISNTITYKEVSGDNDTVSTIIDEVLYVRSKQHSSSIENGMLVLR